MGDSCIVRCVKVSGNDDTKLILQDTFLTLQQEQLNPVWFPEDECLHVKKKEKNTTYVFEVFEGDAFEHIQSLGCRIFGPLCITVSLACMKDIPRRSVPIYNLAMKDVVICCSSISNVVRDELYKKVQWMGGEYQRDFTAEVTHLIVGEVGSKKYQVAAGLGKHIMLPDWVLKVWDKARLKPVHGLDELFQQYKCPVFMGRVMTVSGLSSDERREVKKLVEKEGGTYSGELRVKECTHLIINDAKGQKYQFALKWQIHVVRPEWLYDSIEKGYCQDEAQYPVSGDADTRRGEMKTSTPERHSLATGIANISDISCISMLGVNETVPSNMTNLTRMEEPDNPLDTLDVSRQPSDMFLDGCKIYLSGFRGPDLDKLRKVINNGGGTRFNQINENLTHIIIGERITKDIDQIRNLSVRPHCVVPLWLIESYKQSTLVNEQDYFSHELPILDPKSPKVTKHKQRVTTGKPRKLVDDVAPVVADKAHNKEVNDMDDDIMSQYLARPPEAAANDTTLAPGNNNTMKPDTDLTQDPNDVTEALEGPFSGKSFVFYGFQDEDTQTLASYVKENGGRPLQQTTRCVPDYGIVPTDGFPIDKSVHDIVTNVWLQICVEQNRLLDVRDNPLFTPIEINVDNRPLGECVLSVSGYAGAERDCLMHIAELLGARIQEYFVHKQRGSLLPSTHLVVNAPEGSKYLAAIKWGIPAVSNNWLIACAKSGRRESENSYLIDNTMDETMPAPVQNHVDINNQEGFTNQEKQTESVDIQQVQLAVPSDNKDTEVNAGDIGNSGAKNGAETTDNGPSSTTDQDITVGGQDNISIRQNTELPDFSATGDTEALLLQVNSQDNDNTVCDNQANSLRPNNSRLTDTAIPPVTVNDNQSGTPTIQFRGGRESGIGSATRTRAGVTPTASSQKENMTAAAVVTPVLNRVKELQQGKRSAVDDDTPSKFLNPLVRYRPNFDVADFMDALQTPEQERAAKRRESLPLDELYDLKLEEANQRILQLKDKKIQESQKFSDEIDSNLTDSSTILNGVIIGVSKKLGKDQSDLNDIVSSLGGDYRWNYDSSCTHFLFQGRQNDMAKEFRLARSQKKLIVSPHWLYMCKEQNARVDETLFPHTFNPNMALSVVTGRRTPMRTPARSTRRAARDRANSQKDDGADVMKTNPVLALESKLRETADNTELPSNSGDNAAGAKGSNAASGDIYSKDNPLTSPERSGSEAENRIPTVDDMETDGGSMEMREALSRQLELGSKGKKPKRKSKHLNSSGRVGTPETISTSSPRHVRRTQDESLKNSTGRSTRSSGEEKQYGDVPQSQSVQVVWGDPTEQLEQEKHQHRLQRADSPTQDPCLYDLGVPTDAQYSDTEMEIEPEKPFSRRNQAEPTTPKLAQPDAVRTPTPEGPSIAFPTSKVTNKVTPPKPVELIEEKTVVSRPPPVFMMSGLSQAERDDYGALIEELGGKVLDSQMFDPQCTHLVINNVTRNEKCLASIAAGKWVLHKSYFEACRQEHKFVEEEIYEWGSEGTVSLVRNSSDVVQAMAVAARRWRMQIQQEKQKKAATYGAFCEWRVVLCCGKNEANYKRLLEAGGAVVLNLKSPFTKPVSASHVLWEPNKVSLPQGDQELMVRGGGLCLRPDFISAHLSDPASNVNDYCPEEIKALKAVMDEAAEGAGKKRKASSGDASLKRSRRR